MQLWMSCRARQSNLAKDIDMARKQGVCLEAFKATRLVVNAQANRAQKLYSDLTVQRVSESECMGDYQKLFSEYHSLRV
jgi:hypothetical protein